MLVWVLGAVICGWKCANNKRYTTRVRVFGVVGALCMLFGAVGFLGTGLSATGGLNWLPKSFEWPVGFADNVITTQSGLRIVPVQPSNRIQVYDARWQYLHGWQVDAHGGVFRLCRKEGERFFVITARGQLKYEFDSSGVLHFSGECPQEEYKKRFETAEGDAAWVPTFWPLLMFSHPLLSWLVAFAGFVTIGVVEKVVAKDGAREQVEKT